MSLQEHMWKKHGIHQTEEKCPICYPAATPATSSELHEKWWELRKPDSDSAEKFPANQAEVDAIGRAQSEALKEYPAATRGEKWTNEMLNTLWKDLGYPGDIPLFLSNKLITLHNQSLQPRDCGESQTGKP